MIRLSLQNERGQGLSEYIIIAILVAIIVIVGLRYFGGSVSNQYQSATNEIASLDTGGAANSDSGSSGAAKPASDSGGGQKVEPESGSGSTGSKSVSGSSSRRSGEDIDKEIAKLKSDGAGSKRSTPNDIELSWGTVLTFGAIACIVGVLVVFQSTKSKDKKKKKKKKFSFFPSIKRDSGGQAMVEFMFVSITFLFCVLGVIQLAMCLNAYALVRYAAYNAARAAIVSGGDQSKMLEAARLSLVAVFPQHGRADHVRGFVENYLGAKATDHIPFAMTYYKFKKGSFSDLEYITSVKILDNNGVGGGTVTFDDPVDADKSTVTVQVEHLYELVIPLVNRIIFHAYTLWHDTGSAGDLTLDQRSALTDKRRRTGDFKDIEFRIPLIANYTMRLQSDYAP